MFLNNYLKLLESWMTNYVLSASVTVKDTTGADVSDGPYNEMSTTLCRSINLASIGSVSDKNGSIYKISNNATQYYGNQYSTGASAALNGVIIGDGDTPPTVNDYNLSGNQITDFSATTSISTTVYDGILIIIGTYNITNTGLSPFTIKEIGTSKGNKAGTGRVLLTRDLLATPVAIAPGDTGVVTYKIEIS